MSWQTTLFCDLIPYFVYKTPVGEYLGVCTIMVMLENVTRVSCDENRGFSRYVRVMPIKVQAYSIYDQVALS